MSVDVHTQAELDAALAAKQSTIYIQSEAGLWLTVRDSGSSHVVARGSSHVVARGSSHVDAWGSSHVDARGSSHVDARGSSHVDAWGSSHVVAWGSSHVDARGSSHVDARGSSHVDAWGSSHVVAWDSSHVDAWDSSHVDAWGSSHVVAWGSSHVVAWGSSHVDAWDSSHVDAWGSSHVDAAKYVAVHLHDLRSVVTGGVLIDLTAVDQHDVDEWAAMHGAAIEDGQLVLYKALDAELTAGQGYTPTLYVPGTEVVAADWRDDNQCGGGLHVGPTTSHATAYRSNATRWVKVLVVPADARPIIDGTAKVKVRACRVVAEVDRHGRELSGAAVTS